MRVRVRGNAAMWVAVFVVLAVMVESCGPRRAAVPAAPQPEPAVTVVLLEEEGGAPGRLQVSNSAGARDLTEAATAVRIASAASAPSDPAPISQTEIDRLFGAALALLPEAEESFSFYFLTGRDELTAESEALLPRLFAAIARRTLPELRITGHTDTTGSAESNYELGLRRAERLASILRERGVGAELLSVESHGEGELLVRTGDGVAEPRNRRVEVIVR